MNGYTMSSIKLCFRSNTTIAPLSKAYWTIKISINESRM